VKTLSSEFRLFNVVVRFVGKNGKGRAVLEPDPIVGRRRSRQRLLDELNVLIGRQPLDIL